MPEVVQRRAVISPEPHAAGSGPDIAPLRRVVPLRWGAVHRGAGVQVVVPRGGGEPAVPENAGPGVTSGTAPVVPLRWGAVHRGAGVQVAVPRGGGESAVPEDAGPGVPLAGAPVGTGVAAAMPVQRAAAPARPQAVRPERGPGAEPGQAPEARPRVAVHKPLSAAPATQRSTSPPAKARSGADTPPTRAPGDPREPDLDDLARRLVEPLTRLLRAELRIDRERVGRLRDRRS